MRTNDEIPNDILDGARDDYTRRARCPVCRLTPGLCVCAGLPRLRLPVRFVLLRHFTERHRHSNTGQVVTRLLPNSEVLAFARPGDPFDPARLPDPARSCVLYPLPGAPELPADLLERDPAPTLILLDGTWPKARRMWLRTPNLRRRPCLALPSGPPARYALRKPRLGHQLSTLEAVTRTVEHLGLLEAGELRAATDRILERLCHVRGMLPRSLVR